VLAPGGEVGSGVDVPVGHVAAGVVVAAVGALGDVSLALTAPHAEHVLELANQRSATISRPPWRAAL
jgi:hypothetical protein